MESSLCTTTATQMHARTVMWAQAEAPVDGTELAAGGEAEQGE